MSVASLIGVRHTGNLLAHLAHLLTRATRRGDHIGAQYKQCQPYDTGRQPTSGLNPLAERNDPHCHLQTR